MLARTQTQGIPPDLVDYAKQIEQAVNSVRRPLIQAELSEDASAQWLLVRSVHNEAGRAFRHLARRRFGVFHPVGAFPAGYLFVYVFDAAKMLERIRYTPGVSTIVCALSDAFVSGIMSEYFSTTPKPRTYTSVRGERNIAKAKKPKAKKLTKAERKALGKVRKLLKKLGFNDKSTLESARRLEVHKRITLLKKTANALTHAA